MVYFSVKEAANLLSVNEETVRRWIRKGKLEAERGNGRQGSKISSEALKEYLNQNKGLINSTIAAALGLGISTTTETATAASLLGAVPIIGEAVAGLSWLSVLKSKNKNKAKIKIELLEKEQELENTIAVLKSEIAKKSHQLELVENQLIRLKEVISEIK